MIVVIVLIWLFGFFLFVYASLHLHRLYIRYRRFKKLTENIPEEKCVPVIGNLARFLNMSHVLENTHSDFLKFYTPTKAFLGFELFIQVCDPVYLQIILTSSSSIVKPHQYRYTYDFLHDGLISASVERWKKTRKLMNPLFNQKILEGVMENFAAENLVLVNRLQRELGNPNFDVYDYMSEAIPNVLWFSLTGQDIRFQNTNKSLFNVLQGYTSSLLNRALNPLLHINYIYNLSATKKLHDKCAEELEMYVQKVLREDKNENIENNFLQSFLNTCKNSKLYTDEQMRGELATLLLAAADSTVAAICFTLVILGKYKNIQSKLANELIQIWDDAQVPLTYNQLQSMKYLDRVLKEAMRLYAPVPFVGRRPTEDLQIGEYTLPKDSICLISIYSLHRNARYWPNPEVFDPDRFLPERVANRHPYAYMPFAAGPRMCIGKLFGAVIAKTIVAAIVRNYEITCDLKLEDIKIQVEIVGKAVGGYPIRIEKRQTENIVCND